jgi:hypothetical protein
MPLADGARMKSAPAQGWSVIGIVLAVGGRWLAPMSRGAHGIR